MPRTWTLPDGPLAASLVPATTDPPAMSPCGHSASTPKLRTSSVSWFGCTGVRARDPRHRPTMRTLRHENEMMVSSPPPSRRWFRPLGFDGPYATLRIGPCCPRILWSCMTRYRCTGVSVARGCGRRTIFREEWAHAGKQQHQGLVGGAMIRHAIRASVLLASVIAIAFAGGAGVQPF